MSLDGFGFIFFEVMYWKITGTLVFRIFDKYEITDFSNILQIKTTEIVLSQICKAANAL